MTVQEGTEKKDGVVAVTIAVTDPDTGDTQTEEREVPDHPTLVSELKNLLGVVAEAALWVIGKNGKRKQLADHQHYNAEAGDRFEAIARGGIS